MKILNKRFSSRLSQAGSLMVEAMAMLALISLVTPTLYKKSAERTTELQDINTATHVRTVMKAVDNYAAANYQELIKDLSEGGVKKIDIDDETYASFFPYGYKFDNLKNFGKPKVALRRQGNSITSFVEFPKSMDIGEMRAARIASMIGSNGGYVDAEGKAKGVGGVWSLDSSGLTTLGFDANKGSVVVASSEAINSANSAALENEKYLQRTKVESEDQKWRNAMTTNLYMGGVTGADTMYKILGVDQMIIGSTDTNTNKEDLVITADSADGGSAWLAGSLSAVSNAFSVIGTETDPVLTLAGNGSDILVADSQNIDIYNDGAAIGLNISKNDMKILTDYNTQIENELGVTGNTSVATDEGTTFKAGADGAYLTADASHVNMLNGMVDVNKNAESGSSVMSIKTQKVNIDGDTKIGVGEVAPKRTDLNPKLNVQGNAFVSNILEAGEIDTGKFKALELHAGGESFDDGQQWLNATATGVTVNNPKLADDNRILDIDANNSSLYGPHGPEGGMGSAVVIGDTNAQMRGETYAALYTTDNTGYVTLQKGSMILSGTGEDAANSRIDINSGATSVNEGTFRVQGSSVGGDGTSSTSTSFYVDPISGGKVEIAAKNTEVSSDRLEIKNNPILNVLPDGVAGDPAAMAEMDSTYFGLSDLSGAEAKKIMEVDVDYSINPKEKLNNRGSVYIRRGAIELEPSTGSKEYSANMGYGYIEASRFVANTKYDGTNVDYPKHANDALNPFTGTEYDHYMVNPAYTSVMHDIKLTTRGGARLSDILPDFINKGIYVVNNTYKDEKNLDIDNIRPVLSGGKIAADGASEVSVGSALSGTEMWASPFLGIVPAPQCPPGHARVVTITPAGFMMAQAGQIVRRDHAIPDAKGGGKRYVVDEYTEMQKLGRANLPAGANATISGAAYTSSTYTDEGGNSHELYYLGHATEPSATDASGNPYSPTPLYFQQSNWLKSKVQGQQTASPHSCGGIGQASCGETFVGWSAIMGFVYPGSHYKDIIALVNGTSADKVDADAIYWNVFPVMAQTLEAYATVYCYFDRNNLYQSGIDKEYVDQYDQLNNYRAGYDKLQPSVNREYIDRLNDPTLKYDEPW